MANQSAKIRPLSAILCDDIRIEQNRKGIFIGVYASDIVIYKVPTKLILFLHLLFDATGVGRVPFEIQVKTLNKSMDVTTGGVIEILKAPMRHQHLGITLPKFPATFSGATQLVVRFRRRKGDRWKVFKTFDVIYRPKEAAADDVEVVTAASSEP